MLASPAMPASVPTTPTRLHHPPSPSLSLSTSTPTVHSIYEPTTQSWQYLVADPTTRTCAIIDPVRESSAEEVNVSTQAADALLVLIHDHGYTVSHILETNSVPTTNAATAASRSAAWYLRMQLANRQGFPPQFAGGAATGALERLFERKYGAQGRLNHKLSNSVDHDGGALIGSLRLRTLAIPGPETPERKAFVVGLHVFGAHSIAMSIESPVVPAARASVMPSRARVEAAAVEDADTKLWTSMQRVLSLSEATRVYYDCGSQRADAPGEDPFETVGRCREANPYAELQLKDFLARRVGQRKLARKESSASSSSGGSAFDKIRTGWFTKVGS